MSTTPKFAAGLPAGPGLDWAVRQQVRAGTPLTLSAAPSSDVVRQLWGQLNDRDAAAIIDVAEDAALLSWVAATDAARPPIRSALLRNSHLARHDVETLLAGGVTVNDAQTVTRVRPAAETAELLVDIRNLASTHTGATTAAKTAHLIGRGVSAGARPHLLARAAQLLGDEHVESLLTGVVACEPEEQRAPWDEVLDLIDVNIDAFRADPGHYTNLWERVAQHTAATGVKTHSERLISLNANVAVCATLVSRGAIGADEALRSTHPAHHEQLFERVSANRRLTIEEAHIAVDAGVRPEVLHGLTFEADAANWLSSHTDAAIAGAVVWQATSDQRLAKALTNNPHARRWAEHHLWRLSRVWPKLSNRARHAVVTVTNPGTFLTIGAGELREWLLTDGPVDIVAALTLRRNEIKTVVERARSSGNTTLAWKAALSAERPRDRVAMATLAVNGSSEPDDQKLRRWAREASSGEIVSLWNQLDPALRRHVGKLLIGQLRGGDESSWVTRIVGEVSVRWQHAPDEVQEAAAAYLARNVRNDDDTWEAIWTLYVEWEGTLDELIVAARYA